MRTVSFVGHLFLSTLLLACSSTTYKKTVAQVDRDRYMGDWYVMAGRFTLFEKDVYNAVEIYKWNQKEQRIDIDYHYNKGSLTGPVKKIPQKAWITDENTKATWDVQPFWPLKFTYLVIGLDKDYQWTAVGVPDEGYLWIMSRDPQMPREKIDSILQDLEREGYDTKDIVYVEHDKPKS
jgi:apolipoprotein D and lipocalin family protein